MAKDHPDQMEAAKRNMGALTLHPPKPHEMKIGRPKRVAKPPNQDSN
jgi:hypothetical protein